MHIFAVEIVNNEDMDKKFAGRTAEQWREYARQAVEAKRRAVAEAQESMRRQRAMA